jgi:VanZ family protein
MHKTAATPLALIYAVLIVYASLYPFSDWRNQGIEPWAYLAAPVPKYWSGFDVAINMVGYLPLGCMLALSALRSGRSHNAAWSPVLLASVLASVLSLVMEGLQSYLPVRVSSREDWLLNTVGALLGSSVTMLLERMGAIDRWSQFRQRWFIVQARGGLVLLATWPLALLFPAAVPFGIGQVYERVENALTELLMDTPFLDWLPVRDIELQPLVPGAEMVCVMLGLLVPCLLGFCLIRERWRRAVFVPVCVVVGLFATCLSAALSWGPGHVWSWLDLPTQFGLIAGAAVALLLAMVPVRVSAALALLALGVYLSLLNQAPASAYFVQTLQEWEQGQFIRFNGLAQWLGWLWPYAAAAYAISLVARRDTKN